MEQNFALRLNTMTWVGFRLVNISRLEHVAFRLNPQFWGLSCGGQICICHYVIKIQAILLGKSMAIRLTSLQRLPNSLTNNDLDSIGYLFKLSFLLYCMMLRYLYVRRYYNLFIYFFAPRYSIPRGLKTL